MKLWNEFCRWRYEHHMNWNHLYEQQARTARDQIAYAQRLGLRPNPRIREVAEDANRLAERSWNAAQKWDRS